MKLGIFYHCLLWHGDPPELNVNALNIVLEQMGQLKESGLEDAATEIIVGCNGGEESRDMAKMVLPSKSRLVLHGLQSRSENLTIIEIEKWIPAHLDYYVLYFHSKGALHPARDPRRMLWRYCMMTHCVHNWERCVADLDAGCDAVGCHFMEPPAIPDTQRIFAGNFWWARAPYLATLPSMYLRARIKQSGIDSLESRFESEVWIGNGPRRPIVRDYHRADPRRMDAHPIPPWYSLAV